MKQTIFLILVILGGYSCSTGSKGKLKQKEDFAVFFETFSTDSNFQKSRMLLPLVSETKVKELKEEAYVTALLKSYHASFNQKDWKEPITVERKEELNNTIIVTLKGPTILSLRQALAEGTKDL